MVERDAMLSEMAIVAELPRIMAPRTFSDFSPGVESVGELVIQIMGAGRDVVAPVAFDAVRLLTMALSAPLLVHCRSLSVIVPPSCGMDVS